MRVKTDERVCATCSYATTDDALYCPNDGGPLVRPQQLKTRNESDAYIGHVIANMIEIRSLIGIGAMGRVYRAFQRGIERQVAVKILHKELASNADLVTRFLREAKVASRLEHPGVVQILLSGQLEDGSLYIAMEYLDGLSLQSALAATGGKLPVHRALRVMIQLADAVGEAHARDVVHRDLKPENVMLVKRGDNVDFVKVLDFGIARVQSGDPTVATSAGLIFGTARYISPEGAQGERVGPPGDVYSLATMLYQMLCGRTPFDGEQAVTMLLKQVQEPPPELRILASEVPEPIATVVMRNLAKLPIDRDGDARAFARSLIAAAMRANIALDDVLRPSFPGSRPPEETPAPPPSKKPLTMETREWRPPELDEESDVRSDATNNGSAFSATGAMPAIGAQTIGYSHDVPQSTRETTRQIEPAPRSGDLADDPALSPTPEATPAAPPANRASREGEGDVRPTTGTAMLDRSPVFAHALEPTPSPSPPRAERTEYALPPPALGTAQQYGHYGSAHIPSPPQDDDARRPIPAWLWIVACFGVGAMLTGGALHLFQRQKPVPPPIAIAPGTVESNVELAPPVHDNKIENTPPLQASSTAVTTAPSTSAAVASRAKATLTLAPEKPSIGQTVRFIGAFTGGSNIAGAELAIRGATMPNGVRITAAREGASYRAEYTFLEGGKFDVVFSAKVDGADTRTARTIQIGEVKTAPLPPNVSPPTPTTGPAPRTIPTIALPPPTPVPSTTVRWM